MTSMQALYDLLATFVLCTAARFSFEIMIYNLVLIRSRPAFVLSVLFSEAVSLCVAGDSLDSLLNFKLVTIVVVISIVCCSNSTNGHVHKNIKYFKAK